MRRPQRLLLTMLILAMIIITGYQLIGLKPSETKHDALLMLHQVSIFQLELVSNFLLEASSAETASQLNALKQAVYSAQYTHERFRLAAGTEQLAKLSSIDNLMQSIIRLQIGGDHPLDENEQALFQNTGQLFEPLLEAYETLLSSRGELVRSQLQALLKADQDIAEVFKQ